MSWKEKAEGLKEIIEQGEIERENRKVQNLREKEKREQGLHNFEPKLKEVILRINEVCRYVAGNINGKIHFANIKEYLKDPRYELKVSGNSVKLKLKKPDSEHVSRSVFEISWSTRSGYYRTIKIFVYVSEEAAIKMDGNIVVKVGFYTPSLYSKCKDSSRKGYNLFDYTIEPSTSDGAGTSREDAGYSMSFLEFNQDKLMEIIKEFIGESSNLEGRAYIKTIF